MNRGTILWVCRDSNALGLMREAMNRPDNIRFVLPGYPLTGHSFEAIILDNLDMSPESDIQFERMANWLGDLRIKLVPGAQNKIFVGES